MFFSDHQNLKDSYLVRKTQLSSMCDERERLFFENDGLKNRIRNADYVRDIIEELSLLGQGRALKQYEIMLNAASSDVMEENSKKIRLELTSSSRGYGAPELNIYVERPSGNELIEYNGGSFNNVISLTSRVFAIMRSKHLRNFMALDEADCHIRGPRKGDYEGDSPSTSKRFYNALYKLSRETSMQSMAITHHDVSLFKDIGVNDSDTEGQPNINIMRVIRNEQSGNYIVETTGAPVWENDTVSGIRSITLENIANYHKTTFRLGQGVNIITGSHDIGKSQVVNALRLMFYRSGQGGARLAAHIVRHGQKKGVIRVMIENGIEFVLTIKKSVSRSKTGKNSIKGDLTWEIFDHKNKNDKGQPELYSFNGNICKGGIGNNVPEWVNSISGIELSQVEDGKWDNAIAVQIAEQSQPGFLTANTRPRDRAHILSIGESVNIPRRMKEQNEKELIDAQRTIRVNEKRIKELGGLISRINPIIDNLGKIIEKLYNIEDNIESIKKKKTNIIAYPKKINDLCKIMRRDSFILDNLDNIPLHINNKHNILSYKNIINKIKENNKTYFNNIIADKALGHLPSVINVNKNSYYFSKVKDVRKKHRSYVYYSLIFNAVKNFDGIKLDFSNEYKFIKNYHNFKKNVFSYINTNKIMAILFRVPDIIPNNNFVYNIKSVKSEINKIRSNNEVYLKNILVYKSLNNIPSFLNINEYEYFFNKSKDIKEDYFRYKKYSLVFNIINDIGLSSVNISIKDNVLRLFNKINNDYKKYAENNKIIRFLSSTPDMIVFEENTKFIQETKDRIVRQNERYDRIVNIITCMGKIPVKIELCHYISKIELVINKTRNNIDTLIESSYKIMSINSEFEETNKKYEALINDLKICPLCHNDLKKGHSHV